MPDPSVPSNFAFLEAEWPPLFAEARRAESLVYPDARAACFYARRTLEMTLDWLYKTDAALKRPYQDNLSALLHEATFVRLAGAAIHTKTLLLNKIGNQAVHDSRPVDGMAAFTAVRELFHVLYWLARTYGRTAPAADLRFSGDLLPKTSPVPPQTMRKLQEMEAELGARDAKLREVLAERESLLTGKGELDAELQRLRAEVAESKRRNEARPDTHDYTEAETRDAFLDLLLREAGWALDKPEDREYRVTGMPTPGGEGRVDYVLWGADGKPLGLVEAKRTRVGPEAGQQQAKLYADALEAKFGQRPVIFTTNGYEHWIWDDLQYPPRPVSGFYTEAELQLLVQRRGSRVALDGVATDKKIAGRYYQERAIRNVLRAFEEGHRRKALVVMATGAGKTRMAIALAEILMRANWAKRILFLADRVALVNQAVKAFKEHLPHVPPVNLVTDRHQEGRMYVSTYPTMTGLIDELREGKRRFGPGHFDLIVVDEAHRSIYRKYGAIFDHFDALLVGLTATPKDEIDRNTYGLFALERGVPTDEYGLGDAVADGWLAPSENIAAPLKFPREGIVYDELSEEEKDQWDALEWNEDGEVPDRVDAPSVNQWLFNEDTVDLMLKHLMERGLRVADGDRIGKTIVFAKNHDHAEYIVRRFNHHYPHLAGHFARVIDFQVKFAQSLIDDFSQPEKAPHIAVSVDMLDTGIDIPEIVNLAFFKIVRSKTKFWQMIGRGTRLCENLFGPGRHKKFFRIFDYCENLEYFSVAMPAVEGSLAESLGEKLFRRRVDLVVELGRPERREGRGAETEAVLRAGVVDLLRAEVAGMNLDNFLVRPHRREVERYSQAGAWDRIETEEKIELQGGLAGLPSTSRDDDQDAKQFDLLILRAQLALLRGEAGFPVLQSQLISLASLLEEKSSIPMVARHLPWLREMQADAFWADITVVQLEEARRRLRSLAKLIERVKRKAVYTRFSDELGEESTLPLAQLSVGVDIERLRAKAQEFLRKHEENPALRKLKWNEPLTWEDLIALENIFVAEGASSASIEEAKRVEHGLGLFIRSLVGLDRAAAKRSFSDFLAGKILSPNQNEFINLVIDHLSRRGWIDAKQLYESPFNDFHPHGMGGVFTDAEVEEMLATLVAVKQNAEGIGRTNR